MKIAIIGAGTLGGYLAREFTTAGHQVTICFSRREESLVATARRLGKGIKTATVATAVSNADVIVLAVLWVDIDAALSQAGDLQGKIVIDTTNQFGTKQLLGIPASIAAYNQVRLPGTRLIRAFNMFPAERQAVIASGVNWPVAMFYCVDDATVAATAVQLIQDTGYAPIYLGDWTVASLIDLPDGMLAGKEYLPATALQIAATARDRDIDVLARLIKLTK